LAARCGNGFDAGFRPLRIALSAQGQTQVQKPPRNLLIVQTTHLQDPFDWIAIKQRIELDAPDIAVRIANNEHSNSSTERWQVRRPSLVFSPVHLINYVPRGGAVFCGHILGKDEQLRRLSSIGIPTPRPLDPKRTSSHVTWSGSIDC
jgi:hypothetical protein